MSAATSSARFFGHVTAFAPGRVTLTLQVGAMQEDGRHETAGVAMAISLGNDVTATRRDDGEIMVTVNDDSAVVVDHEDLELGESNIAWRAAHLLREHLGLDPEHIGVDLELTLKIPLSGGLGGQAANAAAVLVACAALWEAGVSRQELADLGARLDDDVPLAIMGGAAVSVGPEQSLSPILTRCTLHGVIVPASVTITSEEVYELLDYLRGTESVNAREQLGIDTELMQSLSRGDAEVLSLMMHNDLQAPVLVLVPEVNSLLDLGMDEGALCGMVSGSGPATVFITRDAEDAVHLAGRIAERTGIAAIPMHGPVQGARLR
ncbi:GHMP family kinase ATP-binding protein [Citricoccus sp. NR2]|uniref:GHMP family kinase ATP-binding protein n=1 Tax=Citricoccus sp. NR2 TaxID=3004095 RepID=UPI0022DD14B0|nr:4-(cytidine 5'-diphospho)-2-C-methyl-D-erythritol kinase [Citricoccus sp. NR2]WBL18958.1 4-(cytidine 5'-diphospho)-2-C-methyl-D-erythritol kinase [Citricoccus sp. NR2]